MLEKYFAEFGDRGRPHELWAASDAKALARARQAVVDSGGDPDKEEIRLYKKIN